MVSEEAWSPLLLSSGARNCIGPGFWTAYVPTDWFKSTEIQIKRTITYKVIFLLLPFICCFFFVDCKLFRARPVSSIFVRFSMRGWLAGRMTFREIKHLYMLLSSGNKDSTPLVFYWLTCCSRCQGKQVPLWTTPAAIYSKMLSNNFMGLARGLLGRMMEQYSCCFFRISARDAVYLC